jgi:hypothetical protein
MLNLEDPNRPIEMQFRCTFRRGFVEHVQLSAADFARHADDLFAHAPVREITVRDDPPFVGTPQLFRTPGLARIRGLTLRGLLHFEAVSALTASPYVAELERLSVERVSVYGVSPTVLGDITNMPRLRELRLASVPVGDDGAAALAGNPVWANLEFLDLSQAGISDEGVRQLAGSPHLARLRKLDLSGNLITGLGVARLVGSNHLGHLIYLNLGRNRLADSVRQSEYRLLARWLGHGGLQPWLQRLLESQLTDRLETLILDRDAVDPGDRRGVEERLGSRLRWA